MDVTVEMMQYLGREGSKKHETETGSKKISFSAENKIGTGNTSCIQLPK